MATSLRKVPTVAAPSNVRRKSPSRVESLEPPLRANYVQAAEPILTRFLTPQPSPRRTGPTPANDAHPLVDIHGRIFAVLAGQPRKQNYQASVRTAYELITKEGIAAGFPATHAGSIDGCTVPSWLNNKAHTPLTERLLADPAINRMAKFASGVFALWAPRLYQQTSSTSLLDGVLSKPSADFDPTKGGHLVLWDLKLVVEFPPGALILIPSATLLHSNIPVQPSDTAFPSRNSPLVDLFRYVDDGYRTEGELAEEDPAEDADKLREAARLRMQQWRPRHRATIANSDIFHTTKYATKVAFGIGTYRDRNTKRSAQSGPPPMLQQGKPGVLKRTTLHRKHTRPKKLLQAKPLPQLPFKRPPQQQSRLSHKTTRLTPKSHNEREHHPPELPIWPARTSTPSVVLTATRRTV
ncbi:hypothetical protein B0H14DRAFT_3439925 [Mycena olivaceomarginata]|nr:hypothetical protein B0H14DRAFT_3439925 [Mycena olivaceomarginata]